jgi:hypothetical protein
MMPSFVEKTEQVQSALLHDISLLDSPSTKGVFQSWYRDLMEKMLVLPANR